ncbi:MAG: hypothetical protein ABIQ18_21600 [Umezawaea sp.]
MSGLAVPDEPEWPVFEAGDEVVLRDHPDAQVFTIIASADDPISNGGRHYFARTESGGTVFLDPAKIQAVSAACEPTFGVSDRVRVMTDAVPSSAPRGATGAVREVENGFVYVKLDHSFSVFPFKASELAALADVPVYRKVLDFAELTTLLPGTVVVNQVTGQVFAKDEMGLWLQPGEFSSRTVAAAEQIAQGLVVVYVPPIT